jgi:hypothetical protein
MRNEEFILLKFETKDVLYLFAGHLDSVVVLVQGVEHGLIHNILDNTVLDNWKID